MRRLALSLLVLLSLPAIADEKHPAEKRLAFYGNFYYALESREGNSASKARVSERNLHFFAGVDYKVNPDSQLWVGARAGIYQEQVLTSVPVEPTHVRPFVGGQMYYLLPFEGFGAFKLGGVADILLAHRDQYSSFPVWLYVGGLAGLRANLGETLFVEAPVELGLTPMFDGTPVFFKMGLQLGFKL